VRCLDPCVLVFSLSLYRHPSICNLFLPLVFPLIINFNFNSRRVDPSGSAFSVSSHRYSSFMTPTPSTSSPPSFRFMCYNKHKSDSHVSVFSFIIHESLHIEQQPVHRKPTGFSLFQEFSFLETNQDHFHYYHTISTPCSNLKSVTFSPRMYL
jgi:hypothetical protein